MHLNSRGAGATSHAPVGLGSAWSANSASSALGGQSVLRGYRRYILVFGLAAIAMIGILVATPRFFGGLNAQRAAAATAAAPAAPAAAQLTAPVVGAAAGGIAIDDGIVTRLDVLEGKVSALMSRIESGVGGGGPGGIDAGVAARLAKLETAVSSGGGGSAGAGGSATGSDAVTLKELNDLADALIESQNEVRGLRGSLERVKDQVLALADTASSAGGSPSVSNGGDAAAAALSLAETNKRALEELASRVEGIESGVRSAQTPRAPAPVPAAPAPVPAAPVPAAPAPAADAPSLVKTLGGWFGNSKTDGEEKDSAAKGEAAAPMEGEPSAPVSKESKDAVVDSKRAAAPPAESSIPKTSRADKAASLKTAAPAAPQAPPPMAPLRSAKSGKAVTGAAAENPAGKALKASADKKGDKAPKAPAAPPAAPPAVPKKRENKESPKKVHDPARPSKKDPPPPVAAPPVVEEDAPSGGEAGIDEALLEAVDAKEDGGDGALLDGASPGAGAEAPEAEAAPEETWPPAETQAAY